MQHYLSRAHMKVKRKHIANRSASKTPKLDDGSNFGSVLRSVLDQPIPKSSSNPILAAAKPNPEKQSQVAEEKARKEAAKLVVAKKKWFEKDHVVPDMAEANYEKMMLKLATKGVVRLFNAVQTQQQQRLEEKGNKVVAPQPDKVTKDQFLDLLKGASALSQRQIKVQKAEEELDGDDEEDGGRVVVDVQDSNEEENNEEDGSGGHSNDGDGGDSSDSLGF